MYSGYRIPAGGRQSGLEVGVPVISLYPVFLARDCSYRMQERKPSANGTGSRQR